MRPVLNLILTLLGAYAVLCALVFVTQRSQIYFPVPESRAPGAEALWLDRGDARIRIWAEIRTGPRALIYFGGNAEDVAQNLPVFRAAFPDWSLYLVNYRGYGGSSGRPTEVALLADAEAVFDEVRVRHPQVAVIGRSLGSGVAVHLAGVRPVERLVLVTPFDSLVGVARAHFPWLPVGLLLLDRFDSASRAAAIRVPVLVVRAARDEIIPRARTEALVAALSQAQVQVVVIDGARHNDIDLDPRYAERLAAFLAP